jgi:hypothetical protein
MEWKRSPRCSKNCSQSRASQLNGLSFIIILMHLRKNIKFFNEFVSLAPFFLFYGTVNYCTIQVFSSSLKNAIFDLFTFPNVCQFFTKKIWLTLLAGHKLPQNV